MNEVSEHKNNMLSNNTHKNNKNNVAILAQVGRAWGRVGYGRVG